MLRFIVVAATVACLALLGSTKADERRIEIIVGAPPGGTAYRLAELAKDILKENLGQEVSVRSEPGAISSEAFAALLEDQEHTSRVFLASVASLSINQVWFPKAGLPDPNDLTFVTGFSSIPLALIGPKQAEISDFTQLVGALRKQGRPTLFASAGTGSTMHFAAEALLQQLDISGAHLPYVGSAAALDALISGTGADIMFEPVTTIRRLWQQDQIAVFGITGNAQVAGMDEVPLLRDLGASVPITQYHGIVGRPSIDEGVAAAIERSILAASRDPKWLARFDELGAIPLSENGTQFKDRVVRDTAFFAHMLPF